MTITLDDLLAIDPAATIINAGKHAGRSEIRGAVRYRPADLLEPAHLALPIARDRPVILYAHDGPSDQLNAIAEKMRGDGFADVRVFGSTLDAYDQAGGAIQEASTEQVVPPQQTNEA